MKQKGRNKKAGKRNRFMEQIISGPGIRRKKISGFTLVQLMVVMAVMGVTASIALPGFMRFAPRMRLKSAARGIVSDMQMARTKSLKERSTWAIQFDTGTSEYVLLSDDGPDDTWNTGDDTVFKTVNLTDGNGILLGTGYGERPSEPYPGSADGVSFADDRILFNSDGTSVSGTVYIKNSRDETFAVGCLSAAGRIKTWRNYGSGWEE